ncbi:hypothetical protein MSIM_41470 [Mycobacterium simiae]|nr:hypothetical protein MSIM_41470 [Mycobacterium simiae]
MSRSRHGVFVYPGGRRKKSGDKISIGVTASGDDHTAGIEPGQSVKVWVQAGDRLRTVQFHKHVQPSTPNRNGPNAKHRSQSRWFRYPTKIVGREVQGDPFTLLSSSAEHTASGSEQQGFRTVTDFPQYVRRGQRATAAQFEFAARTEPTQLRIDRSAVDECACRQIKFARQSLEPFSRRPPRIQQAHRRRVTGKGLPSEGVHGKDLHPRNSAPQMRERKVTVKSRERRKSCRRYARGSLEDGSGRGPPPRASWASIAL